MIIVRAPFRVSFCGGGSDIPSFYQKNEGCVISTTIKKYMFLTIHPCFDKDEIVLKYSQTETVKSYEEIQHKIFKEVLKDMDIKGVEITSVADVPAGTGLGSSSAFTVALLKLLYTYKGKYVSTYHIANEACDVEINRLGNPIGKQDQFASAFGGLRYYEFKPDGFVKIEPIIMSHEKYLELEKNLLLFYTGEVHNANKILKEQTDNLLSQTDKIEIQKKIVLLTKELKRELELNNIDAMGEILAKSWEYKKQLASGITDQLINAHYEKAIKAGAMGGKLLGAGGGGFLLFYVKPDKQEAVRKALKDLKEMEFEFDNSGTTVVYTN